MFCLETVIILYFGFDAAANTGLTRPTQPDDPVSAQFQ